MFNRAGPRTSSTFFRVEQCLATMNMNTDKTRPNIPYRMAEAGQEPFQKLLENPNCNPKFMRVLHEQPKQQSLKLNILTEQFKDLMYTEDSGRELSSLSGWSLYASMSAKPFRVP